MGEALMQAVVLNNGVKMPVLGLGTWKLDDEAVAGACQAAFEVGYRHVDTAAGYGNEVGVGRAVRASGLAREEIFVTTKLGNPDNRAGYDACMRAFEASLKRLDIGYIDLYLMHWPCPGHFKETWRAMEKMYEGGKVRAIGVSNFLGHHLDELLKDARVVPAVDQVEFHPRLVQKPLMKKLKGLGIVEESWSPLMQGKAAEMAEMEAIARRHGKSVAQVIIRWNIQHDVVVIPKSGNPEHIAANAAVFDFELSAEEMAAIDGMDEGRRVGADPDHFNF